MVARRSTTLQTGHVTVMASSLDPNRIARGVSPSARLTLMPMELKALRLVRAAVAIGMQTIGTVPRVAGPSSLRASARVPAVTHLGPHLLLLTRSR